MAIFEKSKEALYTAYDNKTFEFVDRFNFVAQLMNLMTSNLSTGVLAKGSISVEVNLVSQDLTQNFNTGIGDGVNNAFVDISGWSFYFTSNEKIVTITSLTSSVHLSSSKGYIYIKDTGDAEIVSSPYTTYQPDKVRLLRFEKNSLGYYSIVVMPEFAGTPRFLRSISQSQPIMQIKSFAYETNLLSINRLNTSCLTEGSGCLSTSDQNVLIMDDLSPAKLVDEDSNVEYTSIDVTGSAGTYITKQLWLSYDGKFVVQPGTTSYSSLEEATVELPHEYFPIINGDVAGEYRPVLRIAHVVSATDLSNTSQAFILNLTDGQAIQTPPVWYTK